MALLGHWKLDNNYTDSSASGFNGTAGGSGNSFDSSDPKEGSHDLVLNGSGWVDMGNVAEIGKNDAFTFIGWVKNATQSNFEAIIGKKADPVDGSSQGWSVFCSTSSLYFNMLSGSGSLQVNKTCDISGGSWKHIAITKSTSASASGLEFYLNGVAIGSGANIDSDSLAADPSSSSSLRIGASGSGNRIFSGSCDNFRIEKREWTAAEILADFNNPNGISFVPRIASF